VVENIYVNYLIAEGKPFADFTVIALPANILNPNKDSMKYMYAILTHLSLLGKADADFKRKKVFIKGDAHEVARWLKEGKIAIIGDRMETVKLEFDRDLEIMRILFYKAFSRYVEKKGFRVLWGKSTWKRLLPLNINLEELQKQELATIISDDLALYRGLYVKLEIFDDGSAILWVDLYSPIVKLSEQRPLSPKEAKQLGLKDTYTNFIPSPINRLNLTNELLKILCSNSKLKITFADGNTISFSCAFPILNVMNRGIRI
jgi:hypothetical protein